MTITVCIGSSCHLKGSRQVIERLQDAVAKLGLTEQIRLCGAFCMGNCTRGVSVKIDEELFSLSPEGVDAFFENDVLPRLKNKTESEGDGSL